MKKFNQVLMATMLLSTLFFTGAAQTVSAKESKVLEFGTMVGVPAPYTRGNGNAIRGIDGGGVPWVIGSAEGELKASGKLEIKVSGLVLASTGANPIANFKAVVSCLSKDATTGAATTMNVSTGLFPADAAGNSEIEAMVVLPSLCIAPIIFVTSPTGAWFAATGF